MFSMHLLLQDFNSDVRFPELGTEDKNVRRIKSWGRSHAVKWVNDRPKSQLRLVLRGLCALARSAQQPRAEVQMASTSSSQLILSGDNATSQYSFQHAGRSVLSSREATVKSIRELAAAARFVAVISTSTKPHPSMAYADMAHVYNGQLVRSMCLK